MNRYLLLAAAASVVVTGPLPDLQWQNNNKLVDLAPESPTALTQKALGLNFPVLDKPWVITGVSNVMPPIYEVEDKLFGEPGLNDGDDLLPPPPRIISGLKTSMTLPPQQF